MYSWGYVDSGIDIIVAVGRGMEGYKRTSV